MKKSRYDMLVNTLTGIARKVFQAVPAQERWMAKAIASELRRTGTAIDFRTIEGCLDSLVDIGLVRESPGGYFMRVVPKEHDTVVDHGGEEEETLVEELSAPEPVAEAPSAEVISLVTELPFHVAPNDELPKPDGSYEHYLNLRYERIMKALTVLSEHVDEETGLGLLDIVDDMDELQDLSLEYYRNLSDPPATKIVLNPGWYQHDIGGMDIFTRSPEPPTAEEIKQEKDRVQANFTEFHNQHKNFFEHMGAEEKRIADEVFREFEPEGAKERPYYDSLLDKLKNRIPELDTDTSEERMDRVRGKIRRGICDVKVDGVSQSAEYRVWTNLIAPQGLAQLQELGLNVAQSWQDSFKAFLQDVGYKPHFSARLVRIDKDKGWYQENVEWRLNGQALPGRLRRPNGWPLNQGRVSAAKDLDRASRTAVKELLRPTPKR